MSEYLIVIKQLPNNCQGDYLVKHVLCHTPLKPEQVVKETPV